MPYTFEIAGVDIDLESLPTREATVEERRRMFGSVGAFYEMRLPVLYCTNNRKFYPIDHYNDWTVFFIREDTELVVLRTNRTLPWVFRKKERKPRQIWR